MSAVSRSRFSINALVEEIKVNESGMGDASGVLKQIGGHGTGAVP